MGKKVVEKEALIVETVAQSKVNLLNAKNIKISITEKW